MKVNVTLDLDSKEEELLNKIVANNEKLGYKRTQERILTDVIEVGCKWDTFLYEKMSDYLMLMGGCSYEESKIMLDEYKTGLDAEYENQKKIDYLFNPLPISRTDFTLVTGKFLDSEVDIDYIVNTWNECNNDEGKYLVNTQDNGYEFGLKKHSLQEEGTVTYESLKRDMEGAASLPEQQESEGDIPHQNDGFFEPGQMSAGESFIRKFYVIKDLAANFYDLTVYDKYKDALDAYTKLDKTKCKAFGIENYKGLPLDIVQCKDGKDVIIQNFKNTPGWDNPEVNKIASCIFLYLADAEEYTDMIWNGSMYNSNIESGEEELEPEP